MIAPGQVTEVRAIALSTAACRSSHTEADPYALDHLDDGEEATLEVLPDARGIDFTPNPLQSALHTHIPNRLRVIQRGEPVADKDVSCRRWLLLDLDTGRATILSSSEEEKILTPRFAEQIRAELSEEGWPEPILTERCHGHNLTDRVDLSVNDDSLVLRCLLDESTRFSTDTASIDKTVFNPVRWGPPLRDPESLFVVCTPTGGSRELQSPRPDERATEGALPGPAGPTRTAISTDE
jgi:hypothetical protein